MFTRVTTANTARMPITTVTTRVWTKATACPGTGGTDGASSCAWLRFDRVCRVRNRQLEYARVAGGA